MQVYKSEKKGENRWKAQYDQVTAEDVQIIKQNLCSHG